MNLTRSVSYAVGILLRIEGQKSKSPMTAAQISKGCKFPPRFLYRVLRRLVDAGLLTGVSGPGGGYQLAKPASKITLWEIVVAVEGTPQSSKLDPVSPKQRKAIKAINDVAQRCTQRCKQELQKQTLSKLARL